MAPNRDPSSDHRMERLVALGLTVFIVLFCAAVIWRDEPIKNPNTAVFMRILLAAACGVLAGTIPGFLRVGFDAGGLTVRATGAIALAVLVYVCTPTVLTNIQTPTERALDRAKTGDIGQHYRLVNDYWDLPKNSKMYTETPLEDRARLIDNWIGDDPAKSRAMREIASFLAEIHGCMRDQRCDPVQLCRPPLFDDADNFLIFFQPQLRAWAATGYEQTLADAKQFINCDCAVQRNVKRCKNHPTMCSSPPSCST